MSAAYQMPIQTTKFLFVWKPEHEPYSHLHLPFVVTRFAGASPYCEVHGITPDADAWLFRSHEEVALLYREIVKHVHAMDVDKWRAAGGRIKAPSGSDWDTSLAWLPGTETGTYALLLGDTQ